MSAILTKFRDLMSKKGLAVYVLPRTDQHQSEYICPCDERVAFLSGFTGSNALALISQKDAFLWTDSRYYLQAEAQLQEGWTMKKMAMGQKKWFEHLTQNYPENTRIGIDTRLITAETGVARIQLFKDSKFELQLENSNLVDEIWENRTPSSAGEIFLHEEWAGKSMSEKVNWVRNQVKTKQGNGAIFSDLSEIGWLLNLRSSEIPYNPFFKSVFVLTLEGGSLYLPKGHVSLKSQVLIEHLGKQQISLQEYEPVFQKKLLIKKNTLNYHIFSSLVGPIEWDGIGVYRAVRTEKELNGFRRCHRSDAIAMAKFWNWRSKQEVIGEYEAAKYLDNERMKQEHNKGLSFTTISGGGANAAIVHYHPTEKVSSLVTREMIHLVDSGGQYLDGTTDVTRTFHFGKPTPEEKDAFTRVLLGNLDVERLRWPSTSKITGGDIDVLARRHLWAKGLDYGHGTGHGVGYFQGVHEGPCGISKYNTNIFQAGMIVTNEPGYYETGKYGIRIENMLIVTEEKGFMGFENLTLCPYDKNLIDLSLLTEEDRKYIDAYHKRIYEIVAALLEDEAESVAWLKEATAPL